MNIILSTALIPEDEHYTLIVIFRIQNDFKQDMSLYKYKSLLNRRSLCISCTFQVRFLRGVLIEPLVHCNQRLNLLSIPGILKCWSQYLLFLPRHYHLCRRWYLQNIFLRTPNSDLHVSIFQDVNMKVVASGISGVWFIQGHNTTLYNYWCGLFRSHRAAISEQRPGQLVRRRVWRGRSGQREGRGERSVAME